MYCSQYGFSEKPFDVTPDSRFLYMTSNHQETLAALVYGIRERRGFICIIGEVGTGKTTLLNAALDRMDDKIRVAFIFNTDVTFDEMLNMALYEWGLIEQNDRLSKVNAIRLLNNFAIEQLAKGGNVVLIVDEAQNLNNSSMENLRLLSNLETRRHKLVQIVLSGQPELDTKLGQYELRQFAQRISLKRYVFPLNEKDTYTYLQHRLTFVNHSGSSPFSSKAQQLIWQCSGGVPRKINILCDNALLIGYGLQKKKIHAGIVQEVAEDLKWSRFSDAGAPLNSSPAETGIPWVETKPPWRKLTVAATIFLVGSLILAGNFFLRNTGFEFTRLAKFNSSIKGVPLEVIQPNNKRQQAQLTFTGKPSQQAMTPKIITEDLPGENAESETYAENIGRLDLAATVREEEKIRLLKVERGKTLYDIIIQTYGVYDGVALNRILLENPEVVDPDRIYPGQIIRIPTDKDQTNKKYHQTIAGLK